MIYKIYTEDKLRENLEKCLTYEVGSKDKMVEVLLEQALERFHDHGMTGEDFDNERLHDCIIDIVKDNYDNIPKLIDEFKALIVSTVNLYHFRQRMKTQQAFDDILNKEPDLKKDIMKIWENDNE